MTPEIDIATLKMQCGAAVAEAEVVKEESAPSGRPVGAFWEGLLKGQYEQLQALELAAMGKVRPV